MKTISLKADDDFDAILKKLASQQHISKSAVIRDAVLRYRDWLERERLREKLLDASLKTRGQHEELMSAMDQASGDGV